MRTRLLLVASLVGCGAPPPPPPAEVAEPPAEPPRAAESDARTRTLAEGDPLVGQAGARVGDFVLENRHLRAVIAAAGHPLGAASGGGHLLALGPADEPPAPLAAVPALDEAGRRAPRAEAVGIGHDGRGGPAIVRLRGHDPVDDQVRIGVDYVLEPGAEALRVVITLENTGRGHYRDLPVGLLVDWGSLEAFAPEGGFGVAGLVRSDWIGGDGATRAVLVSARSGRLHARHERGWTVLHGAPIYLAPRALHVEALKLDVGRAGGLAPLARRLEAERQTVTGTLRIRVTGPDGAPIAGARVLVVGPREDGHRSARTDAAGEAMLTVPPGRHAAAAWTPDRTPVRVDGLEVAADGAVDATIRLGPAGALTFRVLDPQGAPLPARLTFHPEYPEDASPTAPGFEWLPPPPVGPIAAVAGAGRVTLAPGWWTVEADAGPAWSQIIRRVRVDPDRPAALEVALARRLDTADRVALDPLVWARRGPASPMAGAAELAHCVARGLDGVVLLQAGPVEPPPEAPGLRVLGGLTTDDRTFAALPVPPGTAAAADLAELRALPDAPAVAVLRPRAPGGWFERFAFDATDAPAPRGGFSLDFDLLDVTAEPQALADLGGVLTLGHAIAPFGGSTAAPGPDCGSTRLWLPTTALTDAAALATALRTGDVVLSRGPLLDLEVDGVRPGGHLTRAPRHTVTVRVQAAEHLRPSRLRLMADGRPAAELRLPGTGPLDRTWRLQIPGAKRWIALYALSDPGARPVAITGAVRVR